MQIYQLVRRQVIPKPLSEVFAFFSKPENLAEITPKDLGFVVLTPSPIVMRVGALIDYVIRVSGLPVHWRTMITAYEPPYRFIDEQLKGPYAFWHHTHDFSETDNGTVVTDTVRYTLPFGILGRIAHGLFVRRQLENIFTFRAHTIAAIFTAEKDRLTAGKFNG